MRRLPLRRRLGWACIVSFAGAAACSSGPECNVLSCYDGLEIHARSADLLAPGRYTIAVTLDDVSGSCEIIFPRTTELSTCDSNLPMTVHWQSAGFILSVLMPAEHISVVVHRDGVLLGEGAYEPEYQTVETDRSLCSPTCEIARPEALRLGA